MIFDTDVFIWVQRGSRSASGLIDGDTQRFLSLHSYLELLQCATSRKQHEITKRFLKDFGFQVLPLTENIGHRAAVYIEEYALSHGLRAGDAIIAATAVERSLVLCTSNTRHFKAIRDLKVKGLKP